MERTYKSTLIYPLHQKLCCLEGYTGQILNILSILGLKLIGTVVRKDFEGFQSAYDLLNMDTYIGDAPSVGGVFFRELHASLVNAGMTSFTFLS